MKVVNHIERRIIMINISDETANKIANLAWSCFILVGFGAAGFAAGRLSGYNETDLEVANLEGQLAQQGIRIQKLKDTEAYLNDEIED
jgi:hypothetical protein